MSSFESEALIRFSGISLPAGAQVTSASVTLTFEDFVGGHILRGYAVKAGWNPALVGWTNRDTGLTWAVAGAKGAGTDISATAAFSDTSWPATGNVTRTYALDAATVQGWITTPSTNQGIVLVNNEVNNKQLYVFTSEAATPSQRPLLTIEYTTGGGGGDCDSVGAGEWFTEGFAAQTGSFTAEFDATPSAANLDAVVGLSNGAATDFTGLATIVRFNDLGVIDARNGGTYGGNSISYAANVAYHFRLVVNPASHTYSVFVRPAGGSEQTVGSGFAFRTEQATTSILDSRSVHVDSASGSLNVCNFALSSGSGNPTVSITAPADGATFGVNQNVTIQATASDDSGVVAGVQFVVDGTNFGAEDTAAPFQVSYSTGTTSASHTISAVARDAAGHTGTAAPITIQVQSGSTASHPRIWLDTSKMNALKARALASDPRWTELANKCQSYGAVHAAPAVEDYCSPDICSGYYGEDYYSAMLNLGLCYQVGNAIGDSRATGWAQKADQLLAAMATFGTSVGAFGNNDGYGIRFYGNALAIGYDWMHDYLAANHASLLPTIRTTLRGWYDFYQTCTASACMRQHPTSNYFTAYYAFLAYAGIAAEGDTGDATTYWNRFLTLHNVQLGDPPPAAKVHVGIADYYTTYHDGGGFPEGWEYGPDAIRTLSEPALAAKTGKGLDLILSASHPYRYPLNSALYMMHFTWPSLTYMDDRDEIHSFDSRPEGEGNKCPGYAAAPVLLGESLTEMVRRWPTVVPVAKKLQSFVKQLRASSALNDTHGILESKWAAFLFWDDNQQEEPYSGLDRAYRAMNEVAMRSDWTTSAVFGSLRAIAYSDKDQQHEHPDGGALAITRGTGGLVGDPAVDVPFLVNPNFLMRCYSNATGDLEWGTPLREDLLTSSGAHAALNTFRNSTTIAQNLGLYEDDSPGPTNAITKYEDRNGFVYTRADRLHTLYPSSNGITEWARDVVFLRPRFFLVHDRTTSTGGGAYMSWHFAPTPTLATAPLPGTIRYNVNDATKGVFRGSMTSLLPAATIPAPISVYGSNKLYRLEVHPTTASGTIRWLTLFDAASSSGTVAGVARLLTGMTYNGAVITAAGQHNKAVVFGNGSTTSTIPGPLQITIPAALSDVIVADLPSNTKYAVTASVSGSDLVVMIAPNATGVHSTSEQGTLYVTTTATGNVTPGT